MAVIDQERLRTAVVGCGLIGARRAEETSLHSRSRLILCIDTSQSPARQTAERYGAAWSTDWRIAVDDEHIDAIVICTPNAAVYDIALAALARGKHLLVEKPMGCNLAQAEALAAAAAASTGIFKVGFNHRYHPAISKAKELLDRGEVGRTISVRARYGHGGRPGYEKEWRCDPALSGGGELLDQGVHVADLLAWFAGVPDEAFAFLQSAVWPIAPLEDNAFGLLRYRSGVIASVHTSWTQWKNLFSFEIFGEAGSLSIDGLGGSYGPERLIVAKRNRAGGAPSMREEVFEGPDRSWAVEWHQFVDAIEQRTPYWGTPADGVAAMRIVNALYASARDGVVVPLSQ
ncbi:MAG: Gfo/Idh/MocA family oxidoreductase [Candidatus Eremiobacteraeota bacterium]|nr:Gfo/Idh/MocA family oxidoreductase [Candidatus Eremiobacteraeota bacterium]